MMRSSLLLVVLCVACASGCESTSQAPPAGMGDPYPSPLNDPVVSVLNEELIPVLGFQSAIIVQEPGEVMRVEVPMRNLASRQYLLEYRILFYDERGLQLEPPMDWTMIAVDPKQTVRLKGNSLDSTADHYRVEVRWSR